MNIHVKITKATILMSTQLKQPSSPHKDHKNTIQIYFVTVLTHVIALEV